jgi:hypothetical protein
MAAVNDLDLWGTESGGHVSRARVALGAVMVTTLVVVAVAAQLLGPAVAAKAAAAMLPILFVAVLRAPLAGCSIYASLSRRR